jgi:antitoxin PrlF
MQSSATITSKGQITIPLKIRQQLGLKVGDKLEFITQAGQVIVQPARDNTDPFAKYVGILGTFQGGVEEINAWVREMREETEPQPRAKKVRSK